MNVLVFLFDTRVIVTTKAVLPALDGVRCLEACLLLVVLEVLQDDEPSHLAFVILQVL